MVELTQCIPNIKKEMNSLEITLMMQDGKLDTAAAKKHTQETKEENL